MAAEEIHKRKPSILDSDYESSDDEREAKNAAAKEAEPKTKWGKMKTSLKDWGETASCHGIPHMAQANSMCAMAIWGGILFLCAIGFVFLFSSTLQQYLRFEKIVKLNLGLESTNFPSITFCNINPYKMSQIKNVKELKALLQVYESSADGGLS